MDLKQAGSILREALNYRRGNTSSDEDGRQLGRALRELQQKNPALELHVFDERKAAPSWPRPSYEPEAADVRRPESAHARAATDGSERVTRGEIAEASAIRQHQLSDEEARALGELYAKNPMLMAMPIVRPTNELVRVGHQPSK